MRKTSSSSVRNNTTVLQRIIKSSFILIAFIITVGCSSQKEVASNSLKDDPQQENSAETLPYFELTTSNGKTDSNQFLADARPEFLLFISPNWGTCVSELRKLAKSDNELASLANIYIIGTNPGYTFEDLENMAPRNSKWTYALPTDAASLKVIGGLTRSTKILVDEKNSIIGRYKMGEWKLSEWVKTYKDLS